MKENLSDQEQDEIIGSVYTGIVQVLKKHNFNAGECLSMFVNMITEVIFQSPEPDELYARTLYGIEHSYELKKEQKKSTQGKKNGN